MRKVVLFAGALVLALGACQYKMKSMKTMQNRSEERHSKRMQDGASPGGSEDQAAPETIEEEEQTLLDEFSIEEEQFQAIDQENAKGDRTESAVREEKEVMAEIRIEENQLPLAKELNEVNSSKEELTNRNEVKETSISGAERLEELLVSEEAVVSLSESKETPTAIHEKGVLEVPASQTSLSEKEESSFVYTEAT